MHIGTQDASFDARTRIAGDRHSVTGRGARVVSALLSPVVVEVKVTTSR
jgi:hypothetical protein